MSHWVTARGTVALSSSTAQFIKMLRIDLPGHDVMLAANVSCLADDYAHLAGRLLDPNGTESHMRNADVSAGHEEIGDIS